MRITRRISEATRSLRLRARRRLTRAVAAIFLVAVGVLVVAAGIAGWSFDLAVVWIGAWIMLYGLVFIDVDAPNRRSRQ